MKKRPVRVLVGIASLSWSYAPGQVVYIEPEEAERWIKHGIAEPVIETAMAEPPERRVSRRVAKK